MKIYIICPVRNVTEEQASFLATYVTTLESQGHDVHYPPRDVDQSDPHGKNIVIAHAIAMEDCHEVHIYWDSSSTGSLFDLGMATMCAGTGHKSSNLVLVNPEDCPATDHKSFNNVVRWLCGED